MVQEGTAAAAGPSVADLDSGSAAAGASVAAQLGCQCCQTQLQVADGPEAVLRQQGTAKGLASAFAHPEKALDCEQLGKH